VATVREDEGHLSDIVQVTHGGDNGVVRWSWGSDALVLRTRTSPQACGRIVEVHPFADPPSRSAVAGGEVAAFAPSDHAVVYAASPTCAKGKGEA
jgi:hypothetical protein